MAGLLARIGAGVLRRSAAVAPQTRYASGTAQALVYHKYGDPEKVLRLDEQPLQAPQSGEVSLQMLAASMNPADFNTIQGTYGIKSSLPAIGGMEGVAKVSEVGSGTWRTAGVAFESALLKISSNVPVEVAATVAVNPCTALRMLTDFVLLKAGDVVLQNGANSAVGQAVIQIAKDKGVKTINIVRERPNLADTVEWLKALGGDVVVTDKYSTSHEMQRLLSDLPKPKLALNCVGGIGARNISRLLDQGGVLVTYGGMSREPVMIPTSYFIFKDISARGFWVSNWLTQHSTSERLDMINTVLKMAEAGKFTLQTETVPFKDYKKALQKARAPFSSKKQIISFQ
eukprot:jgi/Chlat1/4123/Chrsp269S03957